MGARLEARARARLAAIATMRALKSPAAPSAAFEALTDDQLAFAAQNCDYTDQVRAQARDVLAQRLGAAEASRFIDGFIDALPAPSWLTPSDLVKNDRLFFGARPWLPGIVLALGVLAVIVLVDFAQDYPDREDAVWEQAIADGAVTRSEVSDARTGVTVALFFEEAAERKASLRERRGLDPRFEDLDRERRLAAAAAILSIMLFPLYTILRGLRSKPARVLLLRRFNNLGIGHDIERFSRRWLRPYGQVFTLADWHFRRSVLAPLVAWFSFNPLLLSWRLINIPVAAVIRLFDRSRAGPIVVRDARDFRNFANRLLDRYGLNLEMMRTERKAISVSTNERWWQAVALLLMHAADVVVVDVTEVGEGTEWELEAMLAERVSERIVFVAHKRRAAAARKALLAHGFGAAAEKLFLYTDNGHVPDVHAFRGEMRQAILRRLNA